jgi:hypothetical protein
MPVEVCSSCGTVGVECAGCAARDEMLTTLREDVGNLERELRRYRAENKRLRKEQSQRLRSHDRYPEAKLVLRHWQEVVAPSARELDSDRRLEPVIARLVGGHTVEELCRCADGYALKPYVVGGRRTHEGPKDDWRADADLIFRDAKRVAAGLAIAERADDLRRVFEEQATPTGPVGDATLSPLGLAAVRLASRGLQVFPCRPRSKAPATKHGLKDAKTDVAVMQRTWGSWPSLNVAVATGMVSGVVVLDVDGDVGFDSLHDLEDQHEELPTTKSLTTPSGGQHFWFKHPGVEIRNTAGFPGPGLDVRGDGGYVLVPPSIGTNGVAYTVDEEAPPAHMPVWLVQKLTERQVKVDQMLENGEWHLLLTEGAAVGNRNDRILKVIGSLVARGYSAANAYAVGTALNEKYCSPPLEGLEVQKIVQSVVRMRARNR